jgi:hypothetical protein
MGCGAVRGSHRNFGGARGYIPARRDEARVSTIVTFEDTQEAQAHREAACAPMVMCLLWQMLDMTNRLVAATRKRLLAGHLCFGEGLELTTAASGSEGGVPKSF